MLPLKVELAFSVLEFVWMFLCSSVFGDFVVDVYFFAANCKFCENLDNVNLDQVVIFETGDLLESNAQLHKYRYYMYLKPGEKWTKKSLKDAKKMEVKWNPKPRPDKPERE